jgi:hypothetical protein
MCKGIIGLQIEMLHTMAFGQEIFEGARMAAKEHSLRVLELSTERKSKRFHHSKSRAFGFDLDFHT